MLMVFSEIQAELIFQFIQNSYTCPLQWGKKKIMLLCSIFLRSRQLYHSDVFSKQTGKTELPISMFTQTSSEIQLLLEEPKDTRHSLHEQTMNNCLDHQQEDPKIKKQPSVRPSQTSNTEQFWLPQLREGGINPHKQE